MSFRTISSITAALALGATSAHAVLPAYATTYVGYKYGPGDASFGYKRGYVLGSSSYGPWVATAAGSPGALASATSPAIAPLGPFDVSGAQVDLSYYVELSGPVGVTLPLDLVYRLSVDAPAAIMTRGVASVSFGGRGLAGSTVGADDYQGVLQITSSGPGIHPGYTAGGYASGYISRATTSGSQVAVELLAESDFGGVAYADPLIEIDPSWAAANSELASHFTLAFSDGISNGFGDLGAGGIPEPAVWAMMLVGFGLVGAAARRRDRRTVPTALKIFSFPVAGSSNSIAAGGGMSGDRGFTAADDHKGST